MKRIYKSIDVQSGKRPSVLSLLAWAQNHFATYCFLNSNSYASDSYASLHDVIALGVASHCTDDSKNAFDVLKAFFDAHNDWLFGFLTYDLKNQIEPLESSNHDGINMPVMHFFQPIVLISLLPHGWEIGCLPGYGPLSDPDSVFRSIIQYSDKESVATDDNLNVSIPQMPGVFYDQLRVVKPITLNKCQASGESVLHPDFSQPNIRSKVSKQSYITHVEAIKEHIQKGDIYEMNYCVEFFAKDIVIDPVSVYLKLNEHSPAPFSCLYNLDGRALMGSSPERFLKKLGRRLISQPIKGTIARHHDKIKDEVQKQILFNDLKERSENVMIVDLVRNDLSRSAKIGSVFVEELFGIYTFNQVHHMVSTVVSELASTIHPVDAIRYAFPMGSMTGAPKIRAMQLIEQYEETKRGLFSGSVGYITPDKDFDFNVVIRSILYNAHDKYLAYLAGSAITEGSDPEKEYDECLLKAEAMRKTLEDAL